MIDLLGLVPLPGEGGYFRETHRSDEIIPAESLPARYAARDRGRSHSTQIYFLLTSESPSLMHLVQSDEVFHYYSGDAVEQLHIHPDGKASVEVIGHDLARGERPQVVVPRGIWQGCRIRTGTDSGDVAPANYALLGCTVSPGFDWADFRLGSRAEMKALCTGTDPKVHELILALTPAQPTESAP